jgi:hypothetical protein
MAAPRGPVALLLGSALLVALGLMLWPAPEATSSTGDASKETPEQEIPANGITAPGARREQREAAEHGSRNELATPSTAPPTEDSADPSLIIQVCDHAGTPLAAVPVALRASDGVKSATLWRGQTAGADGLARVPRPRALLQKSTGPAAAIVALPIRPVPMARLDREALPTGPVQLTLPPTGQVIAWIDDLPADQAEAVTVTITATRTEAEVGLEASVHPHHGAATFPFVSLGLSLVVRARREGQNEGDRVPVIGPTGAGEVVHVHLRVNPADDRVVLLMHLQDQAGHALGKRHVAVSLELRGHGSISSSGFDLDADGAGVLRLVTDENFRTLPERSLRLRSQAEAAGETTEALVTVPGALAAGENDLGVVTLLPPPLVCAGMVVDRAGKPIADADLRVFAQPAGNGGRDPQEVRGVSGHSDGTGRFTMRGSTPRSDLLLTATATGYLPRNDVPFLPGAEGLRLELDAAAALAGSVQLDEVVEAPDVLVELTAGSDRRNARVQVNGRLGEFRFDSVPPGIATVAVRLVGEPTGLLLSGLQLPPGEVTRDPRLQEVDLSKGRRAVHFTVVEQGGSLAKDARVAVLNGSGQRSFEGYRLSSGKGRIVTQRSPLEVLVFATGHRYVRVPDLLDDSTVTLPPALRVRLQLPSGCPAPAAPFRLEVRLDARTTSWPDNGSWRFFEGINGEHSGDGTLPWIQGGRAVCDAGGEAVVPVPEPGNWGVAWRLSRHQGDDRVDRWLANDPAAITVSDVAGEQLVTAGLRAEQLEAARARLEGR